MALPNAIGLSDSVKTFTAPANLAAVHTAGDTWARQGRTDADTSRIGVDEWNYMIGSFRGVINFTPGFDPSARDADDPTLLRDAIVAFSTAKIIELLPDVVLDQAPALAAEMAVIPAFVAAVGAAVPINLNASNLTSGTVPDGRLPTRLGTVAKPTSDLNTALESGFYANPPSTTNAPTTAAGIMLVVQYDANFVVQTWFSLAGTVYKRQSSAGVFGAWVISHFTQTELDARYAELVSPSLTGVPEAPTAPVGTKSTQIASTEFVFANTRKFANRLINGDGAISQRVVTAPTDDTYAWDRHYVLTQTAAIASSTLSNVSDGVPSMMRLSQSQVTAQRMGLAQIIEGKNCRDMRGQAVTLLGKLRCSASQAIRYAILEWTGTEDNVVSDVVNSWTNATFTAGQFFNSTTLTVTSVGAITPSAAAVTDFLLTATLSSSVNNVIVMIWTEGTAAQNVTLDIAWEFVRGDAAGRTYPIDVRSFGTELMLCQRYYEKSYALGTAPGTAGTTNGLVGPIVPSNTVANGQSYGSIIPSVVKRAAPTVTIYGYQGGSGKVADGGGTDLAAGSGTAFSIGEHGFGISNSSGGSITTSNNYVQFHWTASSEL